MHLQEIGNLIKARRVSLRLTQEKLAALTGLALRTVKAVESGKGNPALGTLLKITEVLGLEIELRARITNRSDQ